MKKILFALLLISSYANAQFSYKVGIVTPLPVTMVETCTPRVGSVLGEVDYKLSKKLDLSFITGHIMFDFPNGVEGQFTSIPACLGFKYKTQKIYFGTNLGPSFWSEDINDFDLLWTPYVGATTGKISIDARYFNWRKTTNSANTIGLVISYNL